MTPFSVFSGLCSFILIPPQASHKISLH
jgi:hypothetical protein